MAAFSALIVISDLRDLTKEGAMAWYDILTEAELVELESLLDGDGGYDIEAPEIEDEDAWALADMD